MLITHKYRIYPTHAQVTRLEQTLTVCRELFNAGLSERRDAYRLWGKSISYRDQQNQLPEIKEIRPDVAEIHSQVLQDVLRRLDKAFQAFFRRVKKGEKAGFPRFRSRTRYDSFTYSQSGFSIEGNKLRLSNVGHIKLKHHRTIEGKIKTLTITCSGTGKWYACFAVKCDPQPLPANRLSVGIDCGLEKFAMLSSGEAIDNPRFFRSDERALAKAQRQKKRQVAARIHERIANRRRNFAHQLSYALVALYGLIVFENLNIKGMVRNHCLAKSIQDAAWHQLIQFTTYKAESAGRCVRSVDPRGTSQRCSACGATVKKDLSQRLHECTCGLSIDRDWNAARNILSLGLQAVGTQSVEAAPFMGAE